MKFEAARVFIIKKLDKELPADLSYHNARHAEDVFEAAGRLADEEMVSANDKQLLQIAALFHDAGYLIQADGHERISCEIARKELPQFEFDNGQIELICNLIMATSQPRHPRNRLEEIICDADLDYLGADNFSLRANDLFMELKVMGKVNDEKSWNERQIKFLEQHRYFTQSAIRDRDGIKEKNRLHLIASLNVKHGKKENLWYGHVLDYIMMFIGVIIAGYGLEGFLVPNGFLDGGVTGVALLMHKLYNLNLSYAIILVNLPFVLAAIYVVNLNFAIKTLLCITALSFCLYFIHYPFITHDHILAAVSGGFFIGLGIGLIMRAGFALDGIEILALYTFKRSSFSISEIILGINVLIFSIAAIKFGLETALYSMLTYFVATRTIDYVIEGWEAYTSVTIISGKSEELKKKLALEMGRGITIYKGERGFLPGSFEISQNCDIIFTVITRLEVRKLKNVVQAIDPKAFVFVNTIKEASGGIINRKAIH